MNVTYFTDVCLLVDNNLSEPVSVIVRDGVIARIRRRGPAPIDAEVVHGEGKALIPGLIDAHLHVTSRRDLDVLAKYGVTTGIDMASWPPARTAALRAARGTASIISAGVPFIGPAGPRPRFGMPSHAVVSEPDQAVTEVRRRLIDGSDFINIVTEPRGHGGPAPDVVGSIVTAAHEARRVVVAHASDIDSFKMSVAAGADVITHVPTRSPLTHGLARRTPAAVPTLIVSKALTATVAPPGSSYQVARDSVAALHQAGTPIAAGTDAVAAPNASLSIPLGASLHHELELLVGAGLTPAQALHAATSVPAQLFGLDDRGSVAPGLRADLLLIDGDPTTDITTTRNIAGVWIDGVRYPTTSETTSLNRLAAPRR